MAGSTITALYKGIKDIDNERQNERSKQERKKRDFPNWGSGSYTNSK